MALELSGVRLVAENASQFLATMRQGDAALASFAQATGRAASDTAAFARATQQIKLDGLNNQLRDQQTRLGILKQQLAETAQKYGDASTQAQAKAAALTKLSAAAGITEAKIGLLAQQMAAEADAAGNGARAGDQLTRGLKDVEGGAGKAENALKLMASGALLKLGALGVEAFGKLTQAATDFISDGVQGVADYQTAMSVLQATSGASAEQMERVAATAKALGGDLTLPSTSAGSAADAMNALSQAGLNVEDAMTGAKGALQLAAAGQIADAEAAEYTAAALNQFKLAGDQSVRVADLMAASISAAGSKVGQTGQAIQQAGSSFAAAKIPLEVLVTSIDLMAKAGIKGSDAGTSLKTMLTRLQSPTDDAAGKMRQLGISVYDSQGAMRPMREIIEQFSGALGGLTQQERANAVTTIFGADAQRAANIVLAGGVDAYDKMYAAVTKQGAAADQAAAQMGGLGGAVKGLGSQLETLALNALEPLAPLMAGVVNEGAALVGALAAIAGPAMQATIHGAGTLAHIMADVGIPAVTGLAAAMTAYAVASIPSAIAVLPLLVARVMAATTAFGAQALAVTAAMGPFAVIALAVGALVMQYRELQKQADVIAQKIATQRQEYTYTQDVLTRYSQAQTYAKQATQGQADALQKLRDEQQQHMHKLGELQAKQDALTGSSHNTATARLMLARAMAVERGEIDQLGGAITAQAQALDTAIQGYDEQHLRSTDAIEDLRVMRGAYSDIASAIEIDVEALNKLIERQNKATEGGGAALSALATNELAYQAGAESRFTTHQDRLNALLLEKEQAKTATQKLEIDKRIAQENQAYSDQEISAATAYTRERELQRQHLGEMLVEWVNAQALKDGEISSREQALTLAVAKEYGLRADSAQVMFLGATKAANDWLHGTEQSTDGVIGKLRDTEKSYTELRAAQDKIEREIITDVVENAAEAGKAVSAYKAQLDGVQDEVRTRLITEHIDTYSGNSGARQAGGEVDDSGHTARASGGPVRKGRTYLVGERGPELVAFADDGHVYPHDQTRQLLASGLAGGGDIGAGLAAAMLGMPALFGGSGPGYSVPAAAPAAGNVSNSYQDNRSYTMPVHTNNGPGVVQQSYYTMRAQIL